MFCEIRVRNSHFCCNSFIVLPGTTKTQLINYQTQSHLRNRLRLADHKWWQGPSTNRKIASLQLDIYLTLDNEPELSIRLGYIDLIDNEGELPYCFV